MTFVAPDTGYNVLPPAGETFLHVFLIRKQSPGHGDQIALPFRQIAVQLLRILKSAVDPNEHLCAGIPDGFCIGKAGMLPLLELEPGGMVRGSILLLNGYDVHHILQLFYHSRHELLGIDMIHLTIDIGLRDKIPSKALLDGAEQQLRQPRRIFRGITAVFIGTVVAIFSDEHGDVQGNAVIAKGLVVGHVVYIIFYQFPHALCGKGLLGLHRLPGQEHSALSVQIIALGPRKAERNGAD